MIHLLSDLDKRIFLFLNHFHHKTLNEAMEVLSGQTIWIPMIGFILFLGFKKLNTKQFFIFTLFLALTIIASDVTSSSIIKNLIQRLRPCRLEDLKPFIYQFGQRCGGRFGFVSSHAANATALITFSIFSLRISFKKYFFIFLIPLIVGFSRIYLGVHYPGDIIFGYLVGVFWGKIFASFFLQNIYGASRNFSHS